MTLTGPFPKIDLDGEVGNDITAALTTLIKNAPKKGEIPGLSTDRSDKGTTILFPDLPPGQVYVLTATVSIPGNKNLRLAAEAPRGARLRPAEESLKHLLASGGGRRAHTFENLVFHAAGVKLETDARGFTNFFSCAFHAIPKDAWAIETAGPGVVGVHIADCEFSEMDGGGVLVAHTESDNWIIGDNSRFVRMGGIGIEIHSPSVHVRDARFESKLKKAGLSPYIRIADDGAVFSGGQCRISGCRFGGETGEDLHGPPRYAIELAPAHHQSITGVLIDSNLFLGRPGVAPAEDSAKAAIGIARNSHLCAVNGNFFRRKQYKTAVIDEAEGQDNPGTNSFMSNSVDVGEHRLPLRDEIFAHGGVGWQVFPFDVAGQDDGAQ